MTTSFSSLPIIDLSVLSNPSRTPASLLSLSAHLYKVFSTTGFAYLINTPLTFNHDDVFSLAQDFFAMGPTAKMKLAKKSFVSNNVNTYRGYFPTQPGQQDNLKEGFECGPAVTPSLLRDEARHQKFNLSEPNVWPDEPDFPNGRGRLEDLHTELQALSIALLSLLAIAMGKEADYFEPYLHNSLSTLRLLHYPPHPAQHPDSSQPQSADTANLCCTPHTDSGILTLLHQDPTGGLEVQNANGNWVSAPYIPGSIIVNIGDLLAKVSGGRLVATMHRVRSMTPTTIDGETRGVGRLSVPFFFEPGEDCVVRSVDGGEGVVYGEYVRRKMGGWVEYQDVLREERVDEVPSAAVAVKAC